MPNRPSIPAEIEREIFIECGHHCAACGESIPLERAHIIPWSESQDHSAENLICLCANCHARADKEKWGKKTLEAYKRRPWVKRRYEGETNLIKSSDRISLRIDIEFDQFDEDAQRWVQNAIAALVMDSPNAVRKVSVEKSSVKFIIELPIQGARKLLALYRTDRSKVEDFLAPFVLQNLRREGMGPIKTWLDNGWDPIVENALGYVNTDSIGRLSMNQLNQLRKRFDKAGSIEEVMKFIDRQAERYEKRGNDLWTRVKSSLASQLTQIATQQDLLKQDFVKFAKRSQLPTLEGEIRDLLNPKNTDFLEQLQLELARRFFTAVYAICRVQRNGIEFKI